jgi:hypothetical protein
LKRRLPQPDASHRPRGERCAHPPTHPCLPLQMRSNTTLARARHALRRTPCQSLYPAPHLPRLHRVDRLMSAHLPAPPSMLSDTRAGTSAAGSPPLRISLPSMSRPSSLQASRETGWAPLWGLPAPSTRSNAVRVPSTPSVAISGPLRTFCERLSKKHHALQIFFLLGTLSFSSHGTVMSCPALSAQCNGTRHMHILLPLFL